MLDFHSARPPWLDFADPFYYSKGGRKVAMNISGHARSLFGAWKNRPSVNIGLRSLRWNLRFTAH